MTFSKKELNVSIHLLYNFLFTLIYIPILSVKRFELVHKPTEFAGLLIELIIWTIVYYTLLFITLEILFRKKMIHDERDAVIELKTYKFGYFLCVIFLISLVFSIIALSTLNKISFEKEDLIFYILVSIVILSVIKSAVHLFLYRTT